MERAKQFRDTASIQMDVVFEIGEDDVVLRRNSPALLDRKTAERSVDMSNADVDIRPTRLTNGRDNDPRAGTMSREH